MNKKRLVFLSIWLLTTFFAAAPAKGSEGRYAEGEALAVLKNNTGSKLSASAFSSKGAGQSRAASVAASVQANAFTTYAALSEAADAILVHIKSDSQTTEKLIEDLSQNPDVLSAVPNYFNKVSRVPDDPRYSELYAMKRIRAEEAWNMTTGSQAVAVAVIDTGVDATHPDLAENLDMELGKNFTKEDFTDSKVHGTHVIGTIGAVGNNGTGVTGVNWKVKLIPLKVFEGDSAPDTLLLAALEYVVKLQAEGGTRVYAVNLSLGSWRPDSPETVKNTPLYKAYKALDDTNKTVIVVAAGNESREVGVPAQASPFDQISDGDYVYPPSYTGLANMIVVGALDQNDAAATYSNWSATAVDIVAPGDGILSTVPASSSSYKVMRGTSMAVPHVVGAVALLAARNSSLTASELKALLLENSNSGVNPAPKNGINGGGVSHMSRRGLLDVKAAMDKIETLVQSISVTPSPATVMAGLSRQFSAAIYPLDASNRKVTWASGNPSVASVDAETGLVFGLEEGKTVITAHARDESGISGSANVTVVSSIDSVPVEGVSIAPSRAAMMIGVPKQFTATISPSNASDPFVTWASDKPDVAEVDNEGRVYGVGIGNAVISVTTRSGKFYATARVSVEAPSAAEPPEPPTAGATMDVTMSHPATNLYAVSISPAPASVRFFIWLYEFFESKGGLAWDGSSYHGPFAASFSNIGGVAQFDLDAGKLETWDGKSGTVPSGNYSLVLADAATREKYVGRLPGPIVVENSGSSPGTGGEDKDNGGKGGGGGGCDAGPGAGAALFLAAAVLAARKQIK
jgi:subtilisin family serine protease